MEQIQLNNFFNRLDELFREGNGEKIQAHLENHYSRAQAQADLSAQIAVANELGGWYRSQGQLERAKRLYHEVLDLLERDFASDKKAYATSLINAGDVYVADRDFPTAIRMFLQACDLLKHIGLHNSYQMAALHNNLSASYREQGNWIQAERALRQALDILKKFPEAQSEYHTSLINLGQLLTKQGKFDAAKEVLQESLRFYDQEIHLKDPHRPMAYAALGDVAYYQADYDRALECYEESRRQLASMYGKSPIVRQIEDSLTHIRRVKGGGV